jgi:serine/threonine protein kinase
VAKAISAAHSGGVIHCDLTPANILRSGDGQITVCDFGMARYASSPDEIPGGGTASFLSPEQISDAFGAITERSDVYGLGGLLFALLTGIPPMQGRDLPEILSNVLSAKIPPLVSQLGIDCSPELDTVIHRCLQKDPASRFVSADEVASALESVKSRE